MERRDWMGLLARSDPGTLARLMSALGPAPEAETLRPPQTGTVMARGRTGGTGAAFNLGEITATRCALRLADGTEGHAFVQGRDGAHARAAALADALLQGARGPEVRDAVLAPLAEAEARRRAETARRAEATRVEFETMVRGESE